MNDTKPDVPPPRYRQLSGGWKETICDEQEWLARPAPWGIGELPEEIRERKQNLFNSHFYGWLAEFIECPVCRPYARTMFAEDGVEVPFALRGLVDDWRNDRTRYRAWYASFHPNGDCGVRGLIRGIANYSAGLVTQTELFHSAVDVLYGYCDTLTRAGRMVARAEKRRALALELVGPNPFRPVTPSPEWRTDTAVAIARQMYEARDFSAMPVLADALQDAGCDNPDVLTHCRDASQVHVRGCWVVDLVLARS